MVISCSAFGCTNRQKSKSESGVSRKIQFHRFPLQKPELLLKWIVAVKRKGWIPTKCSFLCQDHFTRDDYKTSARHFLKDDAVPSIFNFPTHFQKNVRKRQIVRHTVLKQERKIVDEYSDLDIEESGKDFSCAEPSKIQETTFFEGIDHKETQTIPDVAVKQTQTAKCSCPLKQKLRQKVRQLQSKLRRCNKKIENLTTLLDNVKQKHLDLGTQLGCSSSYNDQMNEEMENVQSSDSESGAYDPTFVPPSSNYKFNIRQVIEPFLEKKTNFKVEPLNEEIYSALSLISTDKNIFDDKNKRSIKHF